MSSNGNGTGLLTPPSLETATNRVGATSSKSRRASNLAISVRDLAKSYTIVHEEKQETLRAEMMQRLRNPMKRPEKETFWALNGVSFDVMPGEVVGIIGRNGAGKSTLLKLLSRITEPTRGEAILHGRVGSLLEVGTGFHPELTGRENVYLNGSVLGMTRKEIDNQFDAIVDFSGTEKFLDTPVKRYSSGMYVRLAFAVAAHLEPEILIVDEVLAVGDMDFQKKCMGKMKDVARAGRTVLFVSHAINSILQLCTRCVYLKNGKVAADGPASQVVDTYIGEGAGKTCEQTWSMEDAPGDDIARLLAVRTRNASGAVTGDFALSETITMEMDFAVLQSGFEILPVFHLFDAQNTCLFSNGSAERNEWFERKYDKGLYRVTCTLPRNLLNDNMYRANAFLVRDYNIVLAKAEDVIQFEMHDDGSGRGSYTGPMMGILRPQFPWKFEQVTNDLTKGFPK